MSPHLSVGVSITSRSMVSAFYNVCVMFLSIHGLMKTVKTGAYCWQLVILKLSYFRTLGISLVKCKSFKSIFTVCTINDYSHARVSRSDSCIVFIKGFYNLHCFSKSSYIRPKNNKLECNSTKQQKTTNLSALMHLSKPDDKTCFD